MGWVRRSGRIAKEIRILLLGTDTSGRVFSEETRTVTLSRHGAGLISRHKLAPDGILILRFLGGSSEAAIRLVGQLGEDVRGYVYGVAFVDPDLDFWELKFPPPPKWRVDFEAPLQCTSCQRNEVIDQSEIEADVYALSESILRFCPTCGTSTQWRRPSSDTPAAPKKPTPPAAAPIGVAPGPPEIQSSSAQAESAPRHRLAGIEVIGSEAPPPAALPPVATGVVARTANRRRDVRTRVSFTACVRHDFAEEIVECGNISKGGFSFRSRRSYPVGTTIEVAVPYYPGTPPIFVTACIRHAVALVHGTFHYGVMYERPTKNKLEV